MRLAAALGVGTMLAACTTTVVGTASPAETSAAAPSETGTPTPTEPPIDVTPAPAPGVGTLVESHRIAAVTSLVPVTFPDRTEGCSPYGPFLDAGDLEAQYFVDGTAAHILDRWGFVAGWGQCNGVPGGGLATTLLVVELSDPESAARAAEELAAAQAIDGYEPTEVPGLDAAALVLDDGGEQIVQVFAPVGRMLA